MPNGPARPLPARRHRAHGMALILVLWILVLLALMAASVLSETRTEVRLAANLEQAAVAEALADGGVELALARLFGGRAPAWPPGAGPWRIALESGEVEIAIRDEAGKLDVNHAEPDLMVRLFTALGLDAGRAGRLAAEIADYRDADEVPRPGGAEDADYTAAGLPYGAKDDLFESLEELRLLPGMTQEDYRRIRPYLTVYGFEAVDSAAADPRLLALVPDLPQQPPLAGGVVLYQGQILEISAHASARSGARFDRLAFILVTGDPEKPYKLVEWRQLSD